MTSMIDYQLAKSVMGNSIIGPDELDSLTRFSVLYPRVDIPFDLDELSEKKNDYYLVLGSEKFSDGTYVTIRNLIKIFGRDPDVFEPCFYNQDWYIKEDFIDKPMKNGWFFIRKDVYSESRAKQPYELVTKYNFPSAITCTYSFFAAWFVYGVKLWNNDFIWCSDTDHNGDRIYVGKYTDIDSVNKNGFSIHRHLSLRECYGCID